MPINSIFQSNKGGVTTRYILKSCELCYVINDFVQGEPLSEFNINFTQSLVNGLTRKRPLVLYTNYEIPSILKDSKKKEIASLCNYIIDGRFRKEYQKDGMKWRSSSNQHVWKNEDGKWRNITYEI